MHMNSSRFRPAILLVTSIALALSATFALAADKKPQPSPQGYTHDMAAHKQPERPAEFGKDLYNQDYESHHTYSVGPFITNPDWAYSELGLNTVLPELYRSPLNHIGDFQVFGLDVPPNGYEWVRYGPDALLINENGGMILQAVRNVFK